jgi:hypothetical protein
MVATMAGISGQSVAEQEETRATMYPNPARESVSILAEDGIQNVMVYDLMGQLILTQNLKGENKCSLNTSDLVSGIYVVKIRTGKGLAAKRLVIH